MNYFELFGLPVGLAVDQDILSSQYLQLQAKYNSAGYPDSSEAQQADAVEKSALVDKGFEILKDTDATIKYVLETKGLLYEEEMYALPPDFLMEMTELNEGLRDDDVLNIEEAETKVFQLQNNLYHGVQHIIDGYNEDTITEGQLLQVKDYYFRKKYLKGILERLGGMRNIAG